PRVKANSAARYNATATSMRAIATNLSVAISASRNRASGALSGNLDMGDRLLRFDRSWYSTVMNRPENLVTADSLTPEAAVERLIALHDEAVEALRRALERFFATGVPPSSKERARFRYPELRLVYSSGQAQPSLSRAYAKFESHGIYATT